MLVSISRGNRWIAAVHLFDNNRQREALGGTNMLRVQIMTEPCREWSCGKTVCHVKTLTARPGFYIESWL